MKIRLRDESGKLWETTIERILGGAFPTRSMDVPPIVGYDLFYCTAKDGSDIYVGDNVLVRGSKRTGDKHLPYSERRPHPKHPNRRQQQEDGLNFVRLLMDACKDIPYGFENPVSVISSSIRKPDQIIQPYMFGEEVSKATCLWLNKLPKLQPTNIVGKGERITFKSGKTMPAWYASLFGKSKAERAKMRSKTFKGIAEAIANQYGAWLVEQHAA